MTKDIILEFDSFSLEATLFEHPVAERFYDSLPQTVSLSSWGKELYGSVKGSFGHHEPQADIPSGGLCYTERGSYFCIFFGQSPAWPVEHIGKITSSDHSKLSSGLNEVTVRKK